MIEEIMRDAEERMQKSVVTLETAFKRIRTGRAHPAILDSVLVSYYGTDTPLNQLGAIHVEDGRSLLINPWEKSIIGDIEKAILKSDLGLNPSNNGDTIRVPMPPLTEETRRRRTSPNPPGSRFATSAATPIPTSRNWPGKKRSVKMKRGAPKIACRN